MKAYPKIYNLGHKDIQELFSGKVNIEEKLDGSQFSGTLEDGILKCRSRGKELDINNPEKIFLPSVIAFKRIVALMNPDYIYRGEAFFRPKHNALAYERVPQNNVIIFDINDKAGSYLPYKEKQKEAERLGFETVPLLYSGFVDNSEFLHDFLDMDSILGDVKIEGIVIKNYDKKLLGKLVSAGFKEVHQAKKPKQKTEKDDIIQTITESYKNEARWQKAVQHLTENGVLKDELKDIGNIIKEVQKDILDECAFDIKEMLFNHFWNSTLKKTLVAGIPEWYKNKLAEKQFEGDE